MKDRKKRVSGLKPLPQQGRSEQVIKALAKFITRQKMVPGDRLPPERDLAEALGVARTSVREAVSQLAALGILEPRIGSGTFLLRTITSDTVYMPLSLDTDGLEDLLLKALEVRRGIEVEASIAAAKRRTEEDIVRMEDALIHMESLFKPEGGSGPADLAFHLSIYDAAHNPLFRQLLEQFRDLFERFWTRPYGRPDFASNSFPYHRTLFEAIRDQDPHRAEQETRKLLNSVEDDIRMMKP
ncbi:FadR/GntR family transcriptional regulator [uncultured Cohaesibacter sp.]|uniref:FadR/GntR family transcriptional regulator n=1 Tax=uncultured Cohaesibacter sp. TaxID=1002546 RepID=UPI002AAB5910|nr:FadR/GntR family transcriptional regulator [uncultured Cohaesibacter sp.]